MKSETTLAVPDVNVLVALTNPAHVFHTESHRWLAETERYATTPVTESGLVRILLNAVIVGQIVTPEQALDLLAGIRADPRAEFLADDSSLADARVDTTGLVGYTQVSAWHLFNLVTQHDGVLVTFDSKLSRAALPRDAARVVTLGMRR